MTALRTSSSCAGSTASASNTTVPSSSSWSKTSGAESTHCPVPRHRALSTRTRMASPPLILSRSSRVRCAGVDEGDVDKALHLIERCTVQVADDDPSLLDQEHREVGVDAVDARQAG